MMLVCLKDGRRIQFDPSSILNKTPIKMDLTLDSTSSLSNQSFTSLSDDDNESLDSFSLIESTNIESGEPKQKKKRQRLTNLSVEEKLQRRKLKNRVAAQSARDRKKAKMEDLEKTVTQLQEQNEKLRKENNLLKENAKKLIDENRKLLKYKQDNQVLLQSSKKRKLEDDNFCVEVAGSAVSVSRVSLPQKLLQQQMFKNLICAFLMAVSLSLKVKKNNSFNNNYIKKVSREHNQISLVNHPRIKITILKLIKLLKLIQNRRVQLSRLKSLNLMMNSTKANLAILIPLVSRLLTKKMPNKV